MPPMTKKSRVESLTVPQQNYVEVIAELAERHGHAHSVEIARTLGVRKPTVTEAVARLLGMGIVKKTGMEIVLTKKGRDIAGDLSNRHETLRAFMVDVLDMDPMEADDAACRIEHTVSASFTARLHSFAEFMTGKRMAETRKRWRAHLGCSLKA